MSGRRLAIAEIEARAEALEECAEHLGQNWTDDARERKAGNALAERLRGEASDWRDRAQSERERLRRLPQGPDEAMVKHEA